jgi:predicted DNA-binding ribbon-helix-helix protein
MDRTTITLDVETRRRLRRIAADRGISMAALIREAIDETMERHAPRPRSLGVAASGTPDTARRSALERPEPRSWR